MIHSSLQGRAPLSYTTWISMSNNFLVDRGYPMHSLLNAHEVTMGMTPSGLPPWAYGPAEPAPAPTHEPQPTGFDTVTVNMTGSLYGGKPSLRPKSPNKIYNIPLYDAFKNKMGKRQTGEIGIEIEAEGMNLFNAPISWWLTHPDGSLRPYKDHPPIEYVLREPISRQDVPKALSYLSKKLKEAGSQFVDSHRTSVHVHVNCQELTVKQIYQYWCMYTIFEEMLVEFSGPDRPGNLFCLSSKQAEYAVNCLEQAIQTENFNEVFSDNLRYTSCNTASLGKFGSLEFRSMRGTVDQDLIQVWIDLLLILRDKALEYECPRGIVEDYTRLGPDAFLRKVFRERGDILGIFLSRPLADRNKSMWEGLRLMKDVAYAITWDKRIPEEKKKESQKEPVAPEYAGFGSYQPFECLDERGLWLMYNEEFDRYRVVNFSNETVSMHYANMSCSFTQRRYWGYNPETQTFGGSGAAQHGNLSEEHYAPEA